MTSNASLSGFRCPSCGGTETGTSDSRRHVNGKRRRRFCKECGHKFSTVEVLIDSRTLTPHQLSTAIASIEHAASALVDIEKILKETAKVAFRVDRVAGSR